MISYKHTQFGYTTIVAIWLVMLVLAGTGLMSNLSLPSVIVVGILLLAVVLFWSLTIEIEGERLKWSFGPGLIRKSVMLADIEQVAPVRIRWWHGWGIHLTGYGWLYNISGFDAVEVRLKDGKQFRLGTDEPEKLVEAIKRAKGQ